MKRIIKNQLQEITGILRKIKHKDFSGNEGTAIKNSSWQIATTLTMKIGSLFFTFIIARLMLPEVFGLYGLALSTILFMGVFSDMGIGTALATFISKTIDKRPGKAKGYFLFLTKYKVLLTILSSMILFLLASWLSNSYYNKPIYYALLAGAIYLPASIFSSHLNVIFISKNNFRPQFVREMVVQVSRLIIIPFSIIYFLSKTSSIETYLFWIFILLSVCQIIGFVYSLIAVKLSNSFEKKPSIELDKKEKHDIIKFIVPLMATIFSGAVFGYIDQIMLGPRVDGQFLGFYQAAFNLITSVSAIVAFSGAAVFPIFVRLENKKLEKAFEKIKRVTIFISIMAAIFMFIAAPLIIKITYGIEYLTSVLYLRILALLLISFPLIVLYSTYYTSQKRTKILSILLIISTVLNIILNYIFISIGLSYSMFYAVLGAGIATIVSRYFYLGGLVIWENK